MSEAVFPILGTILVVLLVLPACALATKWALIAVERMPSGSRSSALEVRYLLLAGSSILPLAWLISAALHQVEPGTAALACLFDHGARTLCAEPGFFAGALFTSLFVLAARRLAAWQGPVEATGVGAAALVARLGGLIARSPELAQLRGRVGVAPDAHFAVGTVGLFAPRVLVGAAYAAELDDEMLRGALGHELEHVRGRDPLRYLVLELALCINPFGRFLLESHAARWQLAREAHCDRGAVLGGAEPLSLADAIVRAARPAGPAVVALGTSDIAALEFRVKMLLAFAEKMPAGRSPSYGAALLPGLGLLLLASLLPHQTGTGALDLLHTGSEHAVHLVWP